VHCLLDIGTVQIAPGGALHLEPAEFSDLTAADLAERNEKKRRKRDARLQQKRQYPTDAPSFTWRTNQPTKKASA